MDYADPTGTSRSVQSLTIALDDAERFHPPEAALQTKQFLSAIRVWLWDWCRGQNLTTIYRCLTRFPDPQVHGSHLVVADNA